MNAETLDEAVDAAIERLRQASAARQRFACSSGEDLIEVSEMLLMKLERSAASLPWSDAAFRAEA